MGWNVTDEQLQAAVAAYEASGGNAAAAAEKLGWARSTLQTRLKIAERRNLLGNALGGPAMAGFSIDRVSTLFDKDGEVRGEWVIQNRERDTAIDFMTLVQDGLKEMPRLPRIRLEPEWTLADTMTMYPVVDHHLGLYAWAKETGQNYDLDIASRAFLGTLDKLFVYGPPCHEALLLGMGDWYHSDNSIARTERSNNPLDTDSRYAKVLDLGVQLWKQAIVRALEKHLHVTVRILRGNHDDRSAYILALCLREAFGDNPRVTVDADPSLYFFTEWGQTMIGAHHGHTVKAEEFPQIMAAIKPEMWGRTRYRYAFSGHYHRTQTGPRSLEKGGATYEIFPASTARDAFTAEGGYTSNRKMEALIFTKTGGEAGRYMEYIKGE